MIKTIVNLLGNYKSRKLLLYFTLSIVMRPLDWIMSNFLKLVNSSSPENQKTSYNPIFIIGLPRSGTTILYQYLTQVFNVSYLNNLWAIFPKSAPYLNKFTSPKPTSEFKSFYGNGLKLRSTQEGGSIFNKWFPDQKNHYYSEIPEKKLNNFKNYFNLVIAKTNKACLIKSGRNIVRLNVIKEAFPDAMYIRLSRDPLSVAKSIYQGRIELYKDSSKNWTVKPQQWQQIENFDISKQIAYQVYYLDQKIDEDLKSIPDDNKIEILYEDFCNSPYQIAEEITNKFQEISFRNSINEDLKQKQFIVSKKKSSDQGMLDELKETLVNLINKKDI